MTREEREEAIKWFENRKSMNLDDKCQDMENRAIEALKAEPCEGAVSRADVLGYLTRSYHSGMGKKKSYEYNSKFVSMMPSVQPTAKENLVVDAVSREAVRRGMLKYGFHTDVMTVTEFVEDELPPVTPKQKWIPVDYDRYPETYPKPFQEVWITDGYGKVEHKAYCGTRNIKAWMPYIIPEPYKEGVSE